MATQATDDASPLHDLTGFQRDCLIEIATLDDPAGLRVKESLERTYSAEINHGRLYPNLDTLVDKGLVSKGSHDRRTNKYTITERGRRELASHIDWQSRALGDG